MNSIIVQLMNSKEKKTQEFDVLRVIGHNPKTNQRDLAQKLGFSLGKLNYCLKALRDKGFIKISNFNKKDNKLNYAYLLTPKGISHKYTMAYYFMRQKIKEYEELKKEIKKSQK